MTMSEIARQGRAELESIAAALQVAGLARLVEMARRLLEDQDRHRQQGAWRVGEERRHRG